MEDDEVIKTEQTPPKSYREREAEKLSTAVKSDTVCMIFFTLVVLTALIAAGRPTYHIWGLLCAGGAGALYGSARKRKKKLLMIGAVFFALLAVGAFILALKGAV